MNLKRVIPVLLLKDDELYKTVRFVQPKYVGDPINAVRIFNEKEVDEIIILDIDTTVKGKEPNYELLREIASESFVPMTYGGGIKSVLMFKKLVQLGYERLCINSGFYNDRDLVEKCIDKFGSSSVIIGVDYKNIKGRNVVFVESGKKNTGIELLDYIKQAEESGAGEIFLNSIDRDGTYQGIDFETAKKVSEVCHTPTIICGGVNSIENIKKAFKLNISAVAAGSLFFFYGRHRAVLINYPNKKELEFLEQYE